MHRRPVDRRIQRVDRWLAAPDAVDEVAALACRRDVAVLETIYSCGLRISELCGLVAQDIDWDERLLRVRGKGKKERLLPIGEPALPPDAPMASAEIYAYAERNYSFHSDHGVCAGPRVMIEEFLSVLVDGKLPRGGLPAELDPQVRAALCDLDPVIDYALLGLQAYAAVFSVWPAMARAYQTLESIAAAWAPAGPPMRRTGVSTSAATAATRARSRRRCTPARY
jgi:hypothetical protein